MHDPQEIRRKIDRLDAALDGDLATSAYQGRRDLNEIQGYINHVYQTLSAVIFDGFEGKRDDAASLSDYKHYIARIFQRNEDRMMDRLRHGEIYDDIAQALLKERLEKEVGTHYKNKALNIDLPIKVNMQSLATVGYAEEFKTPYLFFNPRSVVIMSRKLKHAALSHEAAHIALGHTDEHYTPPDDRRKIELDAMYVGALIHGDAKEYNELNHFAIAARQAESGTKRDLGKWLLEKRVKLYERAGKKPGESEALDENIRQVLSEDRYHADYADKLTYPTLEEKIALVDSIKLPAKGGIMGKWTHGRALAEAIKERHVGTGRGQGA